MTLKEDMTMTADVHRDQRRISDSPHQSLHEAVQPLDQAMQAIDAHLQTYPESGQESTITRQEIGRTYETIGPAISRYTEHPILRKAEGQENHLKQLIVLRDETEMIGRTLSRDPSPASVMELELHRNNLSEIRQTLYVTVEITRVVVRDSGQITRQPTEDEEEILVEGAVILEEVEIEEPEAEAHRGALAEEVQAARERIEAGFETEAEGRPGAQKPQDDPAPPSYKTPNPAVPESASYRETVPPPIQETVKPVPQETQPFTHVKEISANEVTVGRFGEEENRAYIVQQGQNNRHELNTCGVASQAMILNELTHSHDYTERQLLEEAVARHLYDNGTSLEDYGELAKLHGMKVEKHESSSQELVRRLANGEAAQVSVNAGILWNDESAYGNGSHNHAVCVTGADVVRNEKGELEIKSVWVNDSGNGKTYEVPFEQFSQAWATSNNYAAYISNPNAQQSDHPAL